MADLAREIPLAAFRSWGRYFRYRVEGFETLEQTETSMVVGYHGGPWAFDLWILAARMQDGLGYFPRAVWHRAWWQVPGLREAVTALGGMPGAPDEATMDEIRARRQHLMVAPGGAPEGQRPFWERGRVDFGKRRGYLRLARRYGLPIIPVVASGVDRTFVGLTHGHDVAAPFVPERFPLWLGVGIGGLWPFAIPFPVQIRQRIGDAIDIAPFGDDLDAAHEHVTKRMQALLDDAAK